MLYGEIGDLCMAPMVKEIIRHYLLDDHQCRRMMFVLLGVLSIFAVGVLAFSITLEPPLSAWFSLSFAAVFSLGAAIIVPFGMAAVIHREKAEGSFQLLCVLPLSKEALFLGTVLAAVIGSLVSALPGFAVAVLTLIGQGAPSALVSFTVGWMTLVMSLLSASLVLTIAMNVNSPTVLGYMIAALFVGLQFPGFLLLSDRIEEKVQALLEPHLWELMAFLFSVRGQFFVGAVLLGLSLLTLCVGVWIFRRKGSYV